MVFTNKEFISTFHSLNGRTIAEKKKNLFLLLNDNSNSKIDFAELRPLTQLEETFKADVAIYYKQKDEMLKLLKQENLAVIEKLLHNDCFIKDICENVSGKSLTADIFPNISYNVKLKLLNKLTLNLKSSSKADEFFHSIQESYGEYLAGKLLASCSEDLILKTLEIGKVELTPKQLQLAIKKNPSITIQIIEKLNCNENLAEKYKYVFRYLMVTNPSILMKLDDKFTHQFKLGRRATRHFLMSNKELFLKHSRELYNLLHTNEIGRCLRAEFGTIFSSILPKSITSFTQHFQEYLDLLDVLPTNEEKFHIMSSTFADHFGDDLLSHPNFLHLKIFQWMSSDFKEKWMETHEKPREMSEEQWISRMNSAQSITLLKKKLSSTSLVSDREKLIIALVETCKINNDFIGLADVCEYVLNKHRNDHLKLKIAFLRTVEDCFKLNKLNEEHWKHLKPFVQLCCVGFMSNYLIEKFIIAFVYFSLSNDLPITDALKLYTQISYGRYNILQFKPEYEKRCLNTFYNVIPLCFSNDDLKHQYIQFLYCVCNWNKRHINDRLSVFTFEKALDILMQSLQSNDCYYSAVEVAIDCVIHEYHKANELNITKSAISHIKYSVKTMRIINTYSLSIVDDLESFMQSIFTSYISIHTLRQCFKNVVDLSTRQQIRTICEKELLSDVKASNTKHCALNILSFVSTYDEFLTFIQDFYPTEPVTNLDDPTYKLQQTIPACLQRFTNPSTALEPLLHFCLGDYMKFAQKSLYYLVYNTIECKLAHFLQKLGERAVSVRKHSIILLLTLLNKTTTNQALNDIMKNEKNGSIRKTLFQSIVNCFLRSGDSFLWELVQQNMARLDVSDTEPVKIVVGRLKKVPKQFYSAYIQFAWKCADKLTLTDATVENKCKILSAITKESVAKLPIDFCVNLIKTHLYREEFQTQMCLFTAKYMMYSRHDNLPVIFEIIQSFEFSSKNQLQVDS